ncbi:MAG: glycosyltransferase [Clostridiales bacterium]|nr:glycosyltransferase [Clostridiales bacterium]
MPRVSIVLPVYNAEKFLSKTLEALINQTCTSYEIIIINDGSKDGSLEIIKEYAVKNTEKIRVVTTENKGVWHARKTGISLAKGEYIGFCDSDDIPLDHMYEKLLEAASKENADIVSAAFFREDMETGKVLSVEMTRFEKKIYNPQKNPGFLPMVNTALWNKLFKADIIKKAVDLDCPPRVLEDMILQSSIYFLCDRILFLSEPLYRYIIRSDSAMSAVKLSEVNDIVENLCQTRKFIDDHFMDIRFLQIFDIMAFIHLGLSVMLRLVQGVEQPVSKNIQMIRKILDEKFPLYKKNDFCNCCYNIKNKNILMRPTIALWCYKTRIISFVIVIYKFMVERIGKEMKW